ncbi:endonuclease Q family protein [Halalkalibacterium halodurans]|uniref:endonuclease Q family protein n=1 Tax=Halalkalibacterium halodurans TaxID=86665 RepID=UPI002E241106|nr:endonuclease Q family protein [Halalkalibacterium halodurans]
MINDHQYVADLHIHLGQTASNRPVKITAARTLTLENIIDYAGTVKGIDIIGVIDCHVPEVLEGLKHSIESGEAYELKGGGIRFPDVTLILGTEIEVYDEESLGPVHVLAYTPTWNAMMELSSWMGSRMKNPTLSSQRLYETSIVLQQKVKELGGLFIPAHAFTPFKGVYGKGVKQSMGEIFDLALIDGIELGLSADTSMADQVEELHRFPFLSNSDAHSLEKLAREYQILHLYEPSFQAFQSALRDKDKCSIVANYGLNPYLGKYYETTCAQCRTPMKGSACETCGSSKVVKGVSERLTELATASENNGKQRPPYVHQIPLEFIPKVGKRTLVRLREAFGTDMDILHQATFEQLCDVIPNHIAEAIVIAREGKATIKRGGGGHYGKMIGTG